MSKRIHLRQERGQSVAEFALVLPLMMLILLGIVQFGMVFKQYITLTDAVREGARKAAVARHRADRTSYVQNAVVTSGSDLGPTFTTGNVSVSSTWTHGEDVVVRATFPFSINIIGVVVHSGTMSGSATERVE
jgi:Flp pilus assembly protein TadG